MRRYTLFLGLVTSLLLVTPAWSYSGAGLVMRPAGKGSTSATAATRLAGSKRARTFKHEIFATDEMRVRLPGSVVGRAVHIAQGVDAKEKPATSLFQTIQGVEAAHTGHAGEVHVVLDESTKKRYGEEFLAAMFSGLEVNSLSFAHADGRSEAVSLDAARTPFAPAKLDLKAPLAVWAGSSHPELAATIAKTLHAPEIAASRLEDGTLEAPAASAAKGQRVVLVQTKRMGDSERFHGDMLEMLHSAYFAKKNGASSVTLVSPYLPYSRSDRMDTPGTSVGAAILPQLMKRAGVDGVVFYSVHQAQEVGIFQALHVQVAHASGEGVLANRIAEHLKASPPAAGTLKVLAPDAGAAKRARVFAKALAKSMNLAEVPEVVVANKERNGNEIKMRFEGNVAGATVVAIDDETASGGTLKEVADAARANGAKSIIGAVSHLTGAAHKKLAGSAVDRLFVLDTLPQDEVKATQGHPIEVVSIAEHVSKVVKGLASGRPVDDLLFFEH